MNSLRPFQNKGQPGWGASKHHRAWGRVRFRLPERREASPQEVSHKPDEMWPRPLALTSASRVTHLLRPHLKEAEGHLPLHDQYTFS